MRKFQLRGGGVKAWLNGPNGARHVYLRDDVGNYGGGGDESVGSKQIKD